MPFRPIYTRVVRQVKKLGANVNADVLKTRTTFARKHTFAIAKAPTKTRIHLGPRLPDVKSRKRRATTTAFSDNATYCVALTNSRYVYVELEKWFKAAFVAHA